MSDLKPAISWSRAGLRSLALSSALLSGCDNPPSPVLYQGYVEGEYINLASAYAGQLQSLLVRRGATVTKGQPLFVLEQEGEQAARVEAEQRLKSAEARLDNLKLGRRAPEVNAIRAQLAQAQAARELSHSQLQQQEKLFAGGFISSARLVEVRAAVARDNARVAEAEAQIRAALLPLGRSAELAGALGDARAARAALAQAAWRLQQKSVSAPAVGLVHDTYFVEGEWVPAGKPVAALLPPGNLKVRLFVPETVVSTLSPGRVLQVSCDGCGPPIRAAITYISTQPEYTPPIIYSKGARAKLVFLVEARPDSTDAAKLRPGQPVDVKLIVP